MYGHKNVQARFNLWSCGRGFVHKQPMVGRARCYSILVLSHPPKNDIDQIPKTQPDFIVKQLLLPIP